MIQAQFHFVECFTNVVAMVKKKVGEIPASMVVSLWRNEALNLINYIDF